MSDYSSVALLKAVCCAIVWNNSDLIDLISKGYCTLAIHNKTLIKATLTIVVKKIGLNSRIIKGYFYIIAKAIGV